jgi:guanosine-3',5'-bis(diphosphate) 3'-pyrophosphohydrolase
MIVETQKINSAYRDLIRAAKHTVSIPDHAKIKRALDLAVEACGEKTILTGEPEILHALSVARIIAGEMGLGLTSIITSLLHDSYNSLRITPEEVEKEFGVKVVEILKISGNYC